ncbi:type II toxin-antitoxin system VapC family toxin [Jiangella gansuensis]|uniref:type II toxin-antitoxin system VapC family toxin n=1 Tax=Jiangella gansuensis TaxID=281473 RepID=UPI000478F1F8|nr:type II toxin-antitoxin system VapC family toxin [Jiangella gansuensis]
MRYLLDTHILLWAARDDARMSSRLREVLTDEENELAFSVVSIWEIVIKTALGRADFDVDASRLRYGAIEAGYSELDVRGPHVLDVATLEPIHSDPFDRLLVAQARAENMRLVTLDQTLLRYGEPVVTGR